ncbi:hypothetical protein INR49_013157, partial [Caranx melampygus]
MGSSARVEGGNRVIKEDAIWGSVLDPLEEVACLQNAGFAYRPDHLTTQCLCPSRHLLLPCSTFYFLLWPHALIGRFYFGGHPPISITQCAKRPDLPPPRFPAHNEPTEERRSTRRIDPSTYVQWVRTKSVKAGSKLHSLEAYVLGQDREAGAAPPTQPGAPQPAAFSASAVDPELMESELIATAMEVDSQLSSRDSPPAPVRVATAAAEDAPPPLTSGAQGFGEGDLSFADNLSQLLFPAQPQLSQASSSQLGPVPDPKPIKKEEEEDEDDERGPDGHGGYQHTVRLARALVELRHQAFVTQLQVREIVELWQKLSDWDKAAISFPLRRQDGFQTKRAHMSASGVGSATEHTKRSKAMMTSTVATALPQVKAEETAAEPGRLDDHLPEDASGLAVSTLSLPKDEESNYDVTDPSLDPGPGPSSSSQLSPVPDPKPIKKEEEEEEDEDDVRGPDGHGGYQHTVRLARALVELRHQSFVTQLQVREIVGLWQKLSDWDKAAISFPCAARVAFKPSVPTCQLRALFVRKRTSAALSPDATRLVEAIFLELCRIHSEDRSIAGVRISRWFAVRRHTKRSKAMMTSTVATALPQVKAEETAAEPGRLDDHLPEDASGLAVSHRGPLVPELHKLTSATRHPPTSQPAPSQNLPPPPRGYRKILPKASPKVTRPLSPVKSEPGQSSTTTTTVSASGLDPSSAQQEEMERQEVSGREKHQEQRARGKKKRRYEEVFSTLELLGAPHQAKRGVMHPRPPLAAHFPNQLSSSLFHPFNNYDIYCTTMANREDSSSSSSSREDLGHDIPTPSLPKGEESSYNVTDPSLHPGPGSSSSPKDLSTTGPAGEEGEPSGRQEEASGLVKDLSTTGPAGAEGEPSAPDSPGEGPSAGQPTRSQEDPGTRQPSRMTLWRRKKQAEEDRSLIEKNRATGFGSFGSPGQPCRHCGLARTLSQGHAFFKDQFFCSSLAGGKAAEVWLEEQ